jgi:hypothetical protein
MSYAIVRAAGAAHARQRLMNECSSGITHYGYDPTNSLCESEMSPASRAHEADSGAQNANRYVRVWHGATENGP